jgi:hypothetical protein
MGETEGAIITGIMAVGYVAMAFWLFKGYGGLRLFLMIFGLVVVLAYFLLAW